MWYQKKIGSLGGEWYKFIIMDNISLSQNWPVVIVYLYKIALKIGVSGFTILPSDSSIIIIIITVIIIIIIIASVYCYYYIPSTNLRDL